MGTAYADGLLLFFGHFSNHDALFFKKGELTWRRIKALNPETGEVTVFNHKIVPPLLHG
jgi:hypothetical protein